jgi:hypothetical protein
MLANWTNSQKMKAASRFAAALLAMASPVYSDLYLARVTSTNTTRYLRQVGAKALGGRNMF